LPSVDESTDRSLCHAKHRRHLFETEKFHVRASLLFVAHVGPPKKRVKRMP
jgi:hypothetical protein